MTYKWGGEGLVVASLIGLTCLRLKISETKSCLREHTLFTQPHLIHVKQAMNDIKIQKSEEEVQFLKHTLVNPQIT